MFNFKYNFIFQTRIENQFTYLAIHISFWLCGLVLWGPNQQITASNTGSLDLTQGLETDGDIIPGNMPDMPDMPGMREGGMPNGLGSKGSEDIRILSISDSCSRLVLARLFWNQILTWGGEMWDEMFSTRERREGTHTWVSVSLSSALNSALSEMDRYCFSLYFFSKAFSWEVVKGVLGFLLGLCFLSKHLTGPTGGLRVRSVRQDFTMMTGCSFQLYSVNVICHTGLLSKVLWASKPNGSFNTYILLQV